MLDDVRLGEVLSVVGPGTSASSVLSRELAKAFKISHLIPTEAPRINIDFAFKHGGPHNPRVVKVSLGPKQP